MTTQTPIITPKDMFECTLQKATKALKLQLKPIVPSLNVYFTTCNLHVIGVYWVGRIDLEVFVENLVTLEKETPYMYNYLMANHKETIEKAKKLFAKLKLQEFPLPQIVVEKDNSSHYPKKPNKRRIQVNDDSIWRSFYNIYTNPSILEIENQTEEHLKEVKPVLEDLCKMIASTAYEHLMSVSKNLKAGYS